MKKSHVASFILTFLFGPLGLFYSSAGWALGTILVAIFFIPATGGIAAIVIWLFSLVWGPVCVSSYNSKVKNLEKMQMENARTVIREEMAMQNTD